MTRTIITLLFVLCITTVLSTPIRSPKKRSFKVNRVEVRNYVPNGPAALKRAYNKFGISTELSSLKKRSTLLGLDDIELQPTGEVATKVNAAANDSASGTGSEDGETPATGTQNDAQFLSPVTIGGQEIIMNFDSGSSDTWVFNTGLPQQAQAGHTVYDPSKSSTFKELQGASFEISYGDGSAASGPVVLDSIDIGGSTVDQQAIGIPDFVSNSFITDSQSNGLVGLAFSKLNTVSPKPQKTFFDNVLPDLSAPVFTAQLKGGVTGSYEFGRIDTTAFTGELTVVPVDSSKGFWEFQSAVAEVNGQQIEIPDGSAMADTGTSLMLVQDEMLRGYWQQVEGAGFSEDVGGVVFPCNATLPDLSVAVGDKYMAKVPGSNLNFAPVNRQLCFGGLQSNQGLPFAIFGDVWFKSQFVVFEATGPSLGVAPHS